ncbi:MAG: hypothetical protein A4E32_01331 [Methanomassiliicoccales archaeon PtaU1.Bin124]|nr:MAG: hypothetical protein A4E32_01331 [Methanomassiliicoccales archaeon PtaU1.Bin124]
MCDGMGWPGWFKKYRGSVLFVLVMIWAIVLLSWFWLFYFLMK